MPTRSNAILIVHALTGDAHVAGFHAGDKNPGWWDDMVGPGKAFDTDKYFIICSNVIGGCKGSTGPSVNPFTGKPYGLDFPVISIGDMVNAQVGLIDHLGIRTPAFSSRRFDGWHAGAGMDVLTPGSD